jgi:glutamyl/glutaminyl-tRNA synthetase
LNLYFKATVKAWKIKLPQLAIPIRWILLGKFDSPAIDEVLVALGEQEVKLRLEQFLAEEKHER